MVYIYQKFRIKVFKEHVACTTLKEKVWLTDKQAGFYQTMFLFHILHIQSINSIHKNLKNMACPKWDPLHQTKLK